MVWKKNCFSQIYIYLQGNENDLKENEDTSLASVDQSSSEKRKSGTEFLKNKLTREVSLPQDSSSMKVAVPIVAVIDPSNAEKGQVKSPIVAVLPHHVKGGELNNQIQFLKDNGEKIQKKAQDYIDQSSLTITPDYWRFSTPSEVKFHDSWKSVRIIWKEEKKKKYQDILKIREKG